jgi:hypothetical protein
MLSNWFTPNAIWSAFSTTGCLFSGIIVVIEFGKYNARTGAGSDFHDLFSRELYARLNVDQRGGDSFSAQ